MFPHRRPLKAAAAGRDAAAWLHWRLSPGHVPMMASGMGLDPGKKNLKLTTVLNPVTPRPTIRNELSRYGPVSFRVHGRWSPHTVYSRYSTQAPFTSGLRRTSVTAHAVFGVSVSFTCVCPCPNAHLCLSRALLMLICLVHSAHWISPPSSPVLPRPSTDLPSITMYVHQTVFLTWRASQST